ncbi:unnamed protein product [Symbiodinium natans]|uniref:Uncharacterized protein n=1 Tax=Symbiodinium natans TaxID=878477 RepID=A0A812TVH1_9DINO|nr:unnamed protein product [Symbiodinium natans]
MAAGRRSKAVEQTPAGTENRNILDGRPIAGWQQEECIAQTIAQHWDSHQMSSRLNGLDMGTWTRQDVTGDAVGSPRTTVEQVEHGKSLQACREAFDQDIVGKCALQRNRESPCLARRKAKLWQVAQLKDATARQVRFSPNPPGCCF